jgi:hypothetical protein
MGQFATETRHWLESAIKQRKLLLRINKSHKSQPEIETAIDTLKRQLDSYPFENDLFIARFFCSNVQSIERILPGFGSSSHEKRMLEFNALNKLSIEITLNQSAGTRKLILTRY